MKHLIIMTQGFPYDNAEPYLKEELSHFDHFDHVWVFSFGIRSHSKSISIHLPPNVTLVPMPLLSLWTYFFGAFLAFFQKDFYTELIVLWRERNLRLRNIFQLVKYLSRSLVERRQFEKYLKRYQVFEGVDELCVYSYRFNHLAHLATQFNPRQVKKVRYLTRAHGIDLYEVRHPYHYLPMRELLLSRLDACVFVSEHGRAYMSKHYPDFVSKYFVFRLGTTSLVTSLKRVTPSNVLRLLSISRVDNIKRVERIYETLQLLDIPVQWTHVGYGRSGHFEELKEAAKNTRKNVSIRLTGQLSIAEIQEILVEEDFDLFLNVSTTEGIPVTIMEAMSVGIPAVATWVGGNPEIVKDGRSGYLIPTDFTNEELRDTLLTYTRLSRTHQEKLREGAYHMWQSHFLAATNYQRFAKFLDELLDT